MFKRFASASISVILIAAASLLARTGEAHAYIDLGSASILLQALLAGLFASLFTLKIFWQRITGSVSRFFSKIKSPKSSLK